MKTERRFFYNLGIAGAVMFLVILFYGVCLDIPFVQYDSLRHFGQYFLPPQPQPVDPLYESSWSIGRPVAAIIENFVFTHFADFSGLSLVRFWGVVLTGIFAFLVTVGLRRNSLDLITSMLLGVFVATMPGVQDRLRLPMLNYSLGTVSAVLAYLIWTSRRSFGVRVGGAAVFQFFTLLCYPAYAFLFLSLLSIDLLWGDPRRGKDIIRNIVQAIALCLTCSFFYYLFAKVVLLPRFPDRLRLMQNTFYKLQLSLQLVTTKLQALFLEGSFFVFNPFSPHGGVGAGYVVLFLILLALAKDQNWDRELRWKRLLGWCVILLLILFAWVISLLPFFYYRVLYPGTLLCAISLVWALSSIIPKLGGSKALTRTCLTAILLLGILGAHRTLALNVWNANAEVTFIRSQLARATPDVKRIHVILPENTGFAFNGQRMIDDVHNTDSSGYGWQISYLVKMGLWKQFSNRPLYDCQDRQDICLARPLPGGILLTRSRPGEPIIPSENMLLVDFNDMVRASEVFREE